MHIRQNGFDSRGSVVKKVKRFSYTCLGRDKRSIESLVSGPTAVVSLFAPVKQSNEEARVSKDRRHRFRSSGRRHPLPMLFMPKSFMCSLLVAKSPGPKLTQPMPTSRGKGLALSCSSAFRMDSRTACDAEQPLARTSRSSAACVSSSNRACTVDFIRSSVLQLERFVVQPVIRERRRGIVLPARRISRRRRQDALGWLQQARPSSRGEALRGAQSLVPWRFCCLRPCHRDLRRRA